MASKWFKQVKIKKLCYPRKKIPIDKSIKPHKFENNNTNHLNTKACFLNDNKRTKIRPYNYSGRHEEQKNLSANRTTIQKI